MNSLLPRQNLLLLQLALRPEAPKKSDIRSVTAGEREELANGGLIAYRREGRADRVCLTDRGWAWLAARENFPLGKSREAGAMLEQLFTLTTRFLRRKGGGFSELFLELPDAEEPSVASQVRAAYLTLTRSAEGAEVRLRELKVQLPKVAPDDLDFVILGMVMAGEAQLRQWDGAVGLEAADHAAAIMIGRTPQHVIRLRV